MSWNKKVHEDFLRVLKLELFPWYIHRTRPGPEACSVQFLIRQECDHLIMGPVGQRGAARREIALSALLPAQPRPVVLGKRRIHWKGGAGPIVVLFKAKCTLQNLSQGAKIAAASS